MAIANNLTTQLDVDGAVHTVAGKITVVMVRLLNKNGGHGMAKFKVGQTVHTANTIMPKRYASKTGKIETIIFKQDDVVVNEARINGAWYRLSELELA